MNNANYETPINGNYFAVSDIAIGDHETRIETPTDAYRVFAGPNGEAQRKAFIAENGDGAVTWEQKSKVWRVPAFAGCRASYIAAKAADCERWGSE